MRRIALIAAVAFGVFTSAHARSAEINAFMSTAVKAATDEILPAFERANGHSIRASFAPSGALVPRFLKGEPVDIFVTDAPALDALIKDGKIAGGRVDLVRTGIASPSRKAH
jgi:molybdate transport system substrate-binding protein